MCNDTMRWAISSEGHTTNEKIVLMVLAYHKNHKNKQCYPGIETIIKETSLSKSSVFRTLQSLEKKGFIKINKRIGARNEYTFPAYESIF